MEFSPECDMYPPMRAAVAYPRRAAIVMLSLFWVLVWTPAAHANHIVVIVPNSTYNHSCAVGGPIGDGPVCRTDNNFLTYYMDSSGTYELESIDRTEVSSVMNSQYDTTDLIVSYDASPVFSGAGETDVIYQEGSTGLPTTADGVTWCNDPTDGTTYLCDQQYIRIRGNGLYENSGLVCHETGHSVGLLHGAQSAPVTLNTSADLGCMQNPVFDGTPLGANQRDYVNGAY